MTILVLQMLWTMLTLKVKPLQGFFFLICVCYFIFLLTNPGEEKRKRTAARSASTPAHSTVGLTRIKYANLRKVQRERVPQRSCLSSVSKCIKKNCCKLWTNMNVISSSSSHCLLFFPMVENIVLGSWKEVRWVWIAWHVFLVCRWSTEWSRTRQSHWWGSSHNNEK